MLLIGSYLNLMLYTLELVAVYLYFANERSKRDHSLITFAVCFTLFTDTLASFAVCADVFSVRAYYHRTPFIITSHCDPDMCLVLGSANIQIYICSRYRCRFLGDITKTFVPQWSHILWIISNSLGPFVVQAFMVLRYWRL